MSDDYARKLIREIADEREKMHAKDRSSRQLTKSTNEVGLIGEFAFGEACGIYPDVKEKRDGDNGVDFIVPVFMKLDVKTRIWDRGLKSLFMLVEENKVLSELYVLCVAPSDRSSRSLVGWMRKEEVLTYPIGDLGTNVRNHQVPALDLHPMDSLLQRIARWPRPGEL